PMSTMFFIGVSLHFSDGTAPSEQSLVSHFNAVWCEIARIKKQLSTIVCDSDFYYIGTWRFCQHGARGFEKETGKRGKAAARTAIFQNCPKAYCKNRRELVK
ncbi:MAG: hypothetical protein LUG58_07210, partial [Clostridiales bacterium]|nr:hypothetical protein [Clostridiales bacterium]